MPGAVFPCSFTCQDISFHIYFTTMQNLFPVLKHLDLSFTSSCCLKGKSYLTLCHPMDCSIPRLSVLHSQSLLRLMSTELVLVSKHFILFHPLLFLSSIFSSIRVFSSSQLFAVLEWPKYWSFIILPMNILS